MDPEIRFKVAKKRHSRSPRREIAGAVPNSLGSRHDQWQADRGRRPRGHAPCPSARMPLPNGPPANTVSRAKSAVTCTRTPWDGALRIAAVGRPRGLRTEVNEPGARPPGRSGRGAGSAANSGNDRCGRGILPPPVPENSPGALLGKAEAKE
jgi:hypothetical protein